MVKKLFAAIPNGDLEGLFESLAVHETYINVSVYAS